jgi:hypothetical protein
MNSAAGDRMNYYHICRECRVEFTGFKRQHTCFGCIARHLPEIIKEAKRRQSHVESKS